MAKKILTPNLAETDTLFKRNASTTSTETQEDKNEAVAEAKEEKEAATPDGSQKPTHTMEKGMVVEVKERTVGKAGRPRARQYNNKGTRPTTFNIPIDMKEQIETCAFFSKVEQADIIRTALKYFLDKHAVGNSLTPDGERMVRDYISETSVKN